LSSEIVSLKLVENLKEAKSEIVGLQLEIENLKAAKVNYVDILAKENIMPPNKSNLCGIEIRKRKKKSQRRKILSPTKKTCQRKKHFWRLQPPPRLDLLGPVQYPLGNLFQDQLAI
jgi:hypothetical protein